MSTLPTPPSAVQPTVIVVSPQDLPSLLASSNFSNAHIVATPDTRKHFASHRTDCATQTFITGPVTNSKRGLTSATSYRRNALSDIEDNGCDDSILNKRRRVSHPFFRPRTSMSPFRDEEDSGGGLFGDNDDDDDALGLNLTNNRSEAFKLDINQPVENPSLLPSKSRGNPFSLGVDASDHLLDVAGRVGPRSESPTSNASLAELEEFAKLFKKKRLEMGFTQGDVGVAMGQRYGVDFSQTTISRFEALNLSLRNMVKLKDMLGRWLADLSSSYQKLAKSEAASISAGNDDTVPGCPTASTDTVSGTFSAAAAFRLMVPASALRRRKRRTTIDSDVKNRLEDLFDLHPKPTSDDLIAISRALDMDREVIRVWFCNRRQRDKRLFLKGEVSPPLPSSTATIHHNDTVRLPSRSRHHSFMVRSSQSLDD